MPCELTKYIDPKKYRKRKWKLYQYEMSTSDKEGLCYEVVFENTKCKLNSKVYIKLTETQYDKRKHIMYKAYEGLLTTKEILKLKK
jgi:hypothetical protein